MNEALETIIVSQGFNAKAHTIWEAITRVDQMRLWFFDNITSFEPIVGFETKFNVLSGDRNFIHLWKITEVIPNKKIACNWKYDDIAGDSEVSFELIEDSDLTLLKLTHTILQPFPDNIPEFERNSGVAGWNYFIKDRLKSFLDKQMQVT